VPSDFFPSLRPATPPEPPPPQTADEMKDKLKELTVLFGGRLKD
jgi:hypothetical protein